MTTTIRKRLIAHRVNGGANRADSIRLLDELISTLAPQNLPAALVYQGFATVTQAKRIFQ